MNGEQSTAWYRFHWLTWIIAGVQISTLVALQREVQVGAVITGNRTTLIHHFGWPARNATVISKRSSYTIQGEDPDAQIHTQWSATSIAFTLAFSLTLVGATVFVLEQWLRSAPIWQISLRGLLALTAVVAVLLVMLPNKSMFYDALGQMGIAPSRYVTFAGSMWRDWTTLQSYPILLGLACLIYSAAWVVGSLLGLVNAWRSPVKKKECS
jgi:hypothetical protein